MSWNLTLNALISISLTGWIVIGFASYIAWESLDAITGMCGGLRHFCHKCKYVLSLNLGLASIVAVWKALLSPASLLTLGFVLLTVALFIWPRTVWRIKQATTLSFTWPGIKL